ncbi:MAG TPA: DUF5715 family protein [Pyrinomonadaceae bacterium]|jgi:hypothetical protein
MIKRVVLLILVIVVIVSGVWAVLYFRKLKRLRDSATQLASVTNTARIDTWSDAVEKVKADRGEAMGGAVVTPPELQHYSERYWFLATQIAEITKYNIPICQDYLELAAMIQRGEMVSVPGVTETYVLYGVAQRVDDGDFTSDEDPNVTRDYEPLRALAKNFDGRSYNLDDPADRQALKANMLSSLRPAALKILDEVAATYHQQFNRPLPVSSLVRPEQYQHSLRRVNRNAVTIETPPHSTGLAFDIDYRYMSGTEQTFVMAELARLKNEGRIEAIRERNANYHVFAFLNGTRPSDDLITASLDEAVPPGREANHAESESKLAGKSSKIAARTAAKHSKSKAANVRHKRGRRR